MSLGVVATSVRSSHDYNLGLFLLFYFLLTLSLWLVEDYLLRDLTRMSFCHSKRANVLLWRLVLVAIPFYSILTSPRSGGVVPESIISLARVDALLMMDPLRFGFEVSVDAVQLALRRARGSLFDFFFGALVPHNLLEVQLVSILGTAAEGRDRSWRDRI